MTTPFPGKSCNDCAMCCKLGAIPDVKEYNVWCQHCSTKSACDIWDSRPQICSDYFCHFMLSDLGEAWRPSKCRLMISTYNNSDGPSMTISVDPSRPDAWRKEPFFANIVHWSSQCRVTVQIGYHTFAVFPDHIDDLGEITDEYQIMTIIEQTPTGPRQRAMRVLKSEVPAGIAVGTPTSLN
jgi:hypothetical protein